MRKILFAIASILVVAGIAFAGSSVPPAVGKVVVPLTVPKAAKADCKSIAAGKTGVATFDVSKTSIVNWRAITSAHNTTAVIVKRKLNSNTVGMPASEERNLPIAAGTSSLVFGKYSTSDNSVTPVVCLDAN